MSLERYLQEQWDWEPPTTESRIAGMRSRIEASTKSWLPPYGIWLTASSSALIAFSFAEAEWRSHTGTSFETRRSLAPRAIRPRSKP